jgi:hypothetical protein
MARSVTTVKPARAEAGHRLYPIGAHSDCPVHQYCAYDGSEPDRCATCHVSTDIGCEHNWGGMPSGKRACMCRACGEIFSSNTAFDAHRKGFECRDPESVGLVVAERGDWAVWANPGEREVA